MKLHMGIFVSVHLIILIYDPCRSSPPGDNPRVLRCINCIVRLGYTLLTMSKCWSYMQHWPVPWHLYLLKKLKFQNGARNYFFVKC